MQNISRTWLAKQGYLLFDGAMGTYLDQELKRCGIDMPDFVVYESLNITNPQMVKRIHQQYINAGAQCIKTNTFGANTAVLQQPFGDVAALLRAGYEIAQEAAKDRGVAVFADMGPINVQEDKTAPPEQNRQRVIGEYKKIVDVFVDLGAENFLFETLNHDYFVKEMVEYIHAVCQEKGREPFIIAQFAITADGFTNIGVSGKRIFADMSAIPQLDAFGFNCVCGPTHLLNYIKNYPLGDKTISIMPNAGYPVTINNRTVFDSSPAYFAEKILELKQQGVKIFGGCCGTTPEHISAIHKALQGQREQAPFYAVAKTVKSQEATKSRFLQKLESGKKVVAVEVDPPVTNEVGRLLAIAEELKLAGADCLTIADCPIARVKADSSMMSAKLKKEIGIDVIPHLTCRDRNINATKALLLGLQVEGIQNVLLVTGDPLPQSIRDEVKSVFHLNATRLCDYVANLNEELFPEAPFAIGAALNVNAPNFGVELQRAKQKIKNGAMYFLTQSIYSETAIANFLQAKQELDAYLLAGIMPIVSYRNACFINNEVSGITIPEDICRRFEGQTPVACKQISLDVAMQACAKLYQAADGFYLTTPLNKVDLITSLLDRLAFEGMLA